MILLSGASPLNGALCVFPGRVGGLEVQNAQHAAPESRRPENPSHRLLCLRGWDGTPANVEFGKLSAVLCPHAKYYFKANRASKWEVLPYSDYLKLGRAMKHGILELFAQTCELVWF